ncbi:shikimate kinase, partial [bacterium]|nr:shikimate kinase [bacterium]
MTGFMGSGKTSVGRKLSRRLERRFIDIDVEIERHEGMSIKD